MKEIAKTAVEKNRKLKTKTTLKTYRKDGKPKKDLEREVEYSATKPCDCETTKN